MAKKGVLIFHGLNEMEYDVSCASLLVSYGEAHARINPVTKEIIALTSDATMQLIRVSSVGAANLPIYDSYS